MHRPTNEARVTAIVYRKPHAEYTLQQTHLCTFTVGIEQSNPDPMSGTKAPAPINVQIWGDLADVMADQLYQGCVVGLEGELAIGTDGILCIRANRCTLLEYPPHGPDDHRPMQDPPF